MDAPTPSSEEQIEQIEKKTTNFTHENKNYILQHSLSSNNITFNIDSLDTQEIYENQYSFDEITKMNRYFLICESLKDIYDEISSLIDNKKFDVDILNNEVNLKFSLPSQKLKEVDFVLKMKNKLVQEDFITLNKRIDSQDKVIREQNIRICSLEYQLNTSNDLVKKLEDRIKKLEEYIYNNNKKNIVKDKNKAIKDKNFCYCKKNIVKIDDNRNNNIVKVNSNKYKVRRVNKDEDNFIKLRKKNRSMIDFHYEDNCIEKPNNENNTNKKIKNLKYNKRIIKNDKEGKNNKNDDFSLDDDEDNNNNDDEGSKEDKDNNNDEESNNDEDNEEEESNKIEEKKIKDEDNRNGEITAKDNLNIDKEKKKNNNDDESYLEDKDNKEDNMEESSFTMDKNDDSNNLKYKKIICKNIEYINIEENSYNTEDMKFVKHEDYGSDNIRKRTNKNYNSKEEMKMNKKNLEEDNSVSVTEDFNEEKIIISKLKQLIGRNCNLDLIYQMIKDGNRTIDFHKKVDIKGPTIILFKTIDGYNFGGYTSKSFKSSGGWIKDPESFLFNLNNLNKFKIKNGSENAAIFYGNAAKYGPEFYDILINTGEIQNGIIFPANFLNKLEDLKEGEAEFICNDVLVYRVNLM